jgi:hypothetical protein
VGSRPVVPPGDVAVDSGAAGAPPQATNSNKVNPMKINNMFPPMVNPPGARCASENDVIVSITSSFLPWRPIVYHDFFQFVSEFHKEKLWGRRIMLTLQ